MDKIYQKRTNILNIADRLHVKKTVNANFVVSKSNAEKNTLKDVVNPLLLDNSKHNLLTVQPGINGKVKHRVYMLRRSRTTEGGSLVCELCGHLSFKLYSAAIEITEEGKRASQWRRTQTEVVKVCRNCYNEHKGNQTGSSKTGRKNKVRPAFDRSPLGSTNGRASNSWHFLRRDVVKAKTKLLVNKKCFEDKFADKYLSFESFETDSIHSSEEEETSYEDSENGEHILPFQLGFKTSLESLKSEQKDASQVENPNDGLTLDMLLENEIVITKSCSEQLLNDSDSTVPTSSNSTSKDLHNDENDIVSSLLEDHEKPMEIVKEENMETKTASKNFINSLINDGLFDYFTNAPGRFRRIRKQTDQEKKLKNIVKKTEDLSRKSRYNGVCRLVTVLNQRKGHYIDNSVSTCLYDVNGNEWRKQDLPSFIGLNTKKYTHGKPNYRQRKKDVDGFLTTLKPKMVVKYKTNTEPPEKESDMGVESIASSIFIKNAPDITNENEGGKTTLVTITEEKILSEKIALKNIEKSSEVVIESIKEKKKDELISKIKEEAGPSKGNSPRGKSNHYCAVCSIGLLKSYNVFTKDTAPLVLLKYFNEEKNSRTIRVCKSCLSAKNCVEKSSPNEKGKKRARSLNEREPTVPAKTVKPNQQVKGVTTKDTTTKVKPNTKSPPKKSQTDSEQKSSSQSSSTKSTQKSEELTKVLYKHLNEENKTLTKNIQKKNSGTSDEISGSEKQPSKISVNVSRNPDAEKLKKITEDENTRYVIVQTTGKALGSSVQKVSSVLNSADNKCSTTEGGDITINGKRYKIDTEFKLNELLKENENASLNVDSHKDLLAQLPNILKTTLGNRTFPSGKYQIIDVKAGRGDKLTNKASNVTIVQKQNIKSAKILPASNCSVITKQKTKHRQSAIDVNKGLAQSGHSSTICQQTTNTINKLKNTLPSMAAKYSISTSSLPSISLQIKEQLKLNNSKQTSSNNLNENKALQPQVPQLPGSKSIITGPVKPIQLIQPPKTISPIKRPMYGSPLNTPMPPKAEQKQNTAHASSSNVTTKTSTREVRGASRLQIGNTAKL